MKDQKGIDYNITFIEACKILKKSKRTVSRYIKEGWLKPERIESQRGTLEYRFNQANLLKFKKPGKTEQKEKTRPENDIITFLKAEIKAKNEQIKNKDEQIKELNQRSYEINSMYNNLQNRLLLTDSNTIYDLKVKKDDIKKDKEDKPDKTGQGINGFFKRLFKGTK